MLCLKSLSWYGVRAEVVYGIKCHLAYNQLLTETSATQKPTKLHESFDCAIDTACFVDDTSRHNDCTSGGLRLYEALS